MNLMKTMRKNKSTVVVILIFIILIFAALAVQDWFFPDERKAIYGDIEGLEEHQFTEDLQEALTTKFKENAAVKEVSYIVKEAKLITVVLTLTDETTIDSAKTVPNLILENVEEKYLTFYDWQVMITKDIEQEGFPLIGYKHHTLPTFTY